MEEWQRRTEIAQRRLHGEFIPEPEIERVFVVDRADVVLCPWCGSTELNLRAAVPNRELEPDEATLLIRCRACRVAFFVAFVEGADGIRVSVEEA